MKTTFYIFITTLLFLLLTRYFRPEEPYMYLDGVAAMAVKIITLLLMISPFAFVNKLNEDLKTKQKLVVILGICTLILIYSFTTIKEDYLGIDMLGSML